MFRFIKSVFKFFVFLSLVITIYTVSYYFVEIRSHTGLLNEKIESYSSLTDNHEFMKDMVFKEESQSSIIWNVSHSLAVDYTESGFRNYRHLIGLHWHFWIWVLYSEEEQYKLWLAMTPNGSGERGMHKASQQYFNKPLDQLSCYQLAQLVVSVRSPSRFNPGSERSNQRIKNRGIVDECND